MQEPSLRPRLERCIGAFDAELPYLYSSLRRLGARPAEIDDLVHQVFLLLVPTWPTAAQRRPFRLHLFGLAARAMAMRQRHPTKEGTHSAEASPLILAALASVPLRRRAVLILSDLDRVDPSEIAGSLSMTRLGVALRLRTARRELEAEICRLATEWREGRFGHPDLLLSALGLRSERERPAKGLEQIRKLQDDILLLKMAMDDLPGTIYFKDRQSRFTRINRQAAAHYGIRDPAFAVGRTDFDFFTGEHAVQALRDEQEIIRTGRPLVSVEEQETLPGGRLRRVWTTKLPLHDRGGDIVGTFGLSRAVSEQGAA